MRFSVSARPPLPAAAATRAAAASRAAATTRAAATSRAAATLAAAATTRAAATLAAAAILTACASVAAPAPRAPHPHPAGSGSAPATPGPPAGSRTEAATLARQMLSRVPLPPGARHLPSAPLPSSLAEPASQYAAVTPSLDQYQLFAAPQSTSAVSAFLARRAPAGMEADGTCQGSGPSTGPFMEVSYQPHAVPAGIAGAELVVTVVPASSGGSLLRADAQVIWYPPRTAAEYIDPARYHAVSITVTIYGRKPHTVHKVVTSQAFIARLAELLDRLQAEPLGPVSCPAIFAEYRLAFSLSRQSRPAVVVTSNETGCGGSGITVNGQQQPPLADHGAVAALADQVVSVTWQL
jgi:hypothetical protein